MTDRERALASLHRDIRSCTRCADAGFIPRAFPIVAGKASDRVMIVGQAPGAVELTTGLPFSGRAGAELRRWLARAGIGEDQLPYRTAITKCFPGKAASGGGDRKPSPPEIANCASWLVEEIAIVRPRILLLVGQLAIERFWGKVALQESVGKSRRDGDRVLIPLPHPSGASRWLNSPTNRALLERALRILRREARGLTMQGAQAKSLRARDARNASRAGAAVASSQPRADDRAPEQEEFLTTDEVARRLRVHPTTILRRLGAVDDSDPSRIPAVRVGRVWRIPRKEFEEWLARSSQASRLAGRQRRLF